MYELSIATKYLRPSWKNLSVSLISLLSVGVIALVVWLVVVFFSVTHGLERSWISKVVGLAAPLRITPTDAYYRSYYHRIDELSAASDFTIKNIGEKLLTAASDPYVPEEDPELPNNFPAAHRDAKGLLKDPVKELFSILAPMKIGGKPLYSKEFLLASAQLKLNLLRPPQSIVSTSSISTVPAPLEMGSISQSIYLSTLDPLNSGQQRLLMPANAADWDNSLRMISFAKDDWIADEPQQHLLPVEALRSQWKNFFKAVTVDKLQSTQQLWQLPAALKPTAAVWRVMAQLSTKEGPITHIIIPAEIGELKELGKQLMEQGHFVAEATLAISESHASLSLDDASFAVDAAAIETLPWLLPKNVLWQVRLEDDSLDSAVHCDQICFAASTTIQGETLAGTLPYQNLMIASVQINEEIAPVAMTPAEIDYAEPILLPRQFREAGARIADRGYIAYYAAGASAMQEQRMPVTVAGFFDPGLLPIGGRLLLAPKSVVGQVRSATAAEDMPFGNGVEVHFDSFDAADQLKQTIQKALTQADVAPYWRIETFREYDFTKDLLQQLSSERHLFSLLAIIIIIVACSNIISMLIILVNDKKIEIAILRAMGAGAGNIALIFGLCGVAMGVIGSALGIGLAIFTLHHLNTLIQFIGKVQGYELFNPHFYGEQLPTELSVDALIFVSAATAAISLLSGLVPAIKAACVKPSEALKSE